MRLKDKVALITGGGGDIAVSIADKFLQNGAAVILFDIDEALLENAVQKLSTFSTRLSTIKGDVLKLDELEGAVIHAEQRYGKLDILVTCAGVLKHMPIDQLTQEDWNRVIGINLTGTFLTCKAAVPAMKKSGKGRIVAISSVGGRTGRPHVGIDYAASKAGVNGLAMCLAKELGPYGINVNSIAPGPLSGRMINQLPPENLKALTSTLCINRLGKSDDIAYAALYLASDEAEWVTGEVLDVNGGAYI